MTGKSPTISAVLSPTSSRLITELLATMTLEGQFQSFSLFNDLPKELQLKIWICCLPDPCLIRVHQSSFDHDGMFYVDRKGMSHYFLADEIITRPIVFDLQSVLCTSHDSRAQALRFYSLSFSDRLPHPIYFDPSNDLVLLSDRMRSMIFWRGQNTKGIRTMVLDIRNDHFLKNCAWLHLRLQTPPKAMWVYWLALWILMEDVGIMRSLEQIYYVINSPEDERPTPFTGKSMFQHHIEYLRAAEKELRNKLAGGSNLFIYKYWLRWRRYHQDPSSWKPPKLTKVMMQETTADSEEAPP